MSFKSPDEIDMRNRTYDRRQSPHQVAATSAGAECLGDANFAVAVDRPVAPDHKLTMISGTPRERGRQYGQHFKDEIQAFLEKEISKKFIRNPPTRDDLLRYSHQCIAAIESYSPPIMAELQGMAEGSGLSLDEIVLVTLHEEVGKTGTWPKVEHCTALAAGPPDTNDGNTYVGENWDWMRSADGLSSMLLWERSEGPSVLSYSYPGLWIAAGLNSAGIALCWTWGDQRGIKGPRVGIPTYVLIAQMLYQETLEAALAEARRATHAGWFTFVLADGEGNLANVEGTPERLVIETAGGHLVRAGFGTRTITDTPPGQSIKYDPKCVRMLDLLAARQGKLDRSTLQSLFADHFGPPPGLICVHDESFDQSTLDSMLFSCTTGEANIQRGPGCSNRWQTFRFPG
jgi:isopenicillin-N N-acyltransferase-like protein